MERRILDTIPANPTVVPYHLQILQLFRFRSNGDSLGPPEDAWGAEYVIKHDYSAQGHS